MKHAKPRTRRKPAAPHVAAPLAKMPSIHGPRPSDVEAVNARHVTIIERDPDGHPSLRRLTSAQYLDKLDDPHFDPLTDLADLDDDGQPIHPDSAPMFDNAPNMGNLDGLDAEQEAATYEASARVLDAVEAAQGAQIKAHTHAPLPDAHPTHKPLPRVDEDEDDDIAASILNHPWIIPAFDAEFDPHQEDPRLLWFLRRNRDAINDFHCRLRLRWDLLMSATTRLRSPVETQWTMEQTCAAIQRSAWLPLPLAWHLSPRNMQFVGPILAPIHNLAVMRGLPPMEVRHDTLKGRREDMVEVCRVFRQLTSGESHYIPHDLAPARLVAAFGPGEVMARGMIWEDAPHPNDLCAVRLD